MSPILILWMIILSANTRRRSRLPVAPFVGPLVAGLAALTLASCGGESTAAEPIVGGTSVDLAPVVMVTTSIWADVVENIACDGSIEVRTVIPPGGDPHGFEPSLTDREQLGRAALVVANGLALEASLVDTLDAVSGEGQTVFRIADHLKTLRRDPHVWFDPRRVNTALPALADALVEHAGLDSEAAERCLNDYTDELSRLDTELAELAREVPAANRTLVTNHDSFGYFADRYDFAVIGTVIPGASTLAESSPAQLEALAAAVTEAGAPAIFAESQHSVDDAQALADRLGGVEIVTLYTGSLDVPGSDVDSYVELLRTNMALIVEALR